MLRRIGKRSVPGLAERLLQLRIGRGLSQQVLATRAGTEPKAERVVDLLKYRKQDVADATNVPITSVRYDTKMPDELRERLREWAIAINLVGTFFKDEHRTLLWFQTPNRLLGDQSPRDLIRSGRFRKLFKFIQTALNENKP